MEIYVPQYAKSKCKCTSNAKLIIFAHVYLLTAKIRLQKFYASLDLGMEDEKLNF